MFKYQGTFIDQRLNIREQLLTKGKQSDGQLCANKGKCQIPGKFSKTKEMFWTNTWDLVYLNEYFMQPAHKLDKSFIASYCLLISYSNTFQCCKTPNTKLTRLCALIALALQRNNGNNKTNNNTSYGKRGLFISFLTRTLTLTLLV